MPIHITVQYVPTYWLLPRTGSTLTGAIYGSHDRHNTDHAKYCNQCEPLMEVDEEREES